LYKFLSNIYKIMPKTSKKRKVVSGSGYFKSLVKRFRDNLPRNWKERVLAKFPDLNNEEGRNLLDNIFYGRSAADAEVILYMDDMANNNNF
jgi:hypothetical protein